MIQNTPLPEDMWKKIGGYLDQDGLARMDLVDKQHHQVALENYDFYVSTVKLKTEIVRENIQILWNNPEANFDVGADGKLTVISRWNIFGRFFKWIRNLDGSVDKAVQNAAKVTLEEAYRLAVYKKEYLYARNRDGSWIFDAAFAYSDDHPINEVACRLSHSHQFGSIDKRTYDLFTKPIFYGNHADFHEDFIIPSYYSCHSGPKENANDFHQAVHHSAARLK